MMHSICIHTFLCPGGNHYSQVNYRGLSRQRGGGRSEFLSAKRFGAAAQRHCLYGRASDSKAVDFTEQPERSCDPSTWLP